MLRRIVKDFPALLLTCAWIPAILIVEGTSAVAGMGFVALYLTRSVISPKGNVFACEQLDTKLGNLRKENLSEILKKPNTIKIRDIRKNITGKCKECSYHLDCYGCRGAAFNSTGKVFNEDPICWI